MAAGRLPNHRRISANRQGAGARFGRLLWPNAPGGFGLFGEPSSQEFQLVPLRRLQRDAHTEPFQYPVDYLAIRVRMFHVKLEG